jgi:hypothetical protein
MCTTLSETLLERSARGAKEIYKKHLEKCVTQFCEHPSISLGCNARNAPEIVLSAASEIVKSWFITENSVRDQIGRTGCRRSGKIYAKWDFFPDLTSAQIADSASKCRYREIRNATYLNAGGVYIKNKYQTIYMFHLMSM